MDNKKKITIVVLLMALVITLGSAVVARKIARGNEEVNTGDLLDYRTFKPCYPGTLKFDSEGRPTCEKYAITEEGRLIVYKDNSVNYTKYVTLQYAAGTDQYTEFTDYMFNSFEEYKEAYRSLDPYQWYEPLYMMSTQKGGAKKNTALVKPYSEALKEIENNNNYTVIR